MIKGKKTVNYWITLNHIRYMRYTFAKTIPSNVWIQQRTRSSKKVLL